MKQAKSSEESISSKQKRSDEPSSIRENEILSRNISLNELMEHFQPSIILERVTVPPDVNVVSIDLKYKTLTSSFF